MYRLKTSKLSHSPLGLGVPSSFKRVQIMNLSCYRELQQVQPSHTVATGMAFSSTRLLTPTAKHCFTGNQSTNTK